MCIKNENPSEDIQRLTKEQFFSQLETLLKSAPENMLYLVNAMEDPESKKNGRQVIALSGSCHKISYAFKNAFEQDHRFEHVVGHAVDYSRFMKSRKSGLFDHRPDFDGSRDHIQSLFEKIFGR